MVIVLKETFSELKRYRSLCLGQYCNQKKKKKTENKIGREEKKYQPEVFKIGFHLERNHCNQ